MKLKVVANNWISTRSQLQVLFALCDLLVHFGVRLYEPLSLKVIIVFFMFNLHEYSIADSFRDIQSSNYLIFKLSFRLLN